MLSVHLHVSIIIHDGCHIIEVNIEANNELCSEVINGVSIKVNNEVSIVSNEVTIEVNSEVSIRSTL